jgi:hypothetical protein
MNIRIVTSVVMLWTLMVGVQAQENITDSIKSDTIEGQKAHKESIGKRLDNKLANRYFDSSYDSSYVVRPKERWLLKPSLNQTGTSIHAKGTVNDVWSKYHLRTKYQTTVSMEVDYCDIALALSLNPAKMHGDYNDYEFTFEYHGNKFSFDLDYQRASSLTGDINYDNIDHLDEDGLNMKVFSLTAYFIFNNKRFSFPAAFYQNYYQLRSAGSWLAGLNFQSGSVRTTDELKARTPEAPEVHITAAHLGIGGGYGYNLVLGKKSQWLLHFSMMPTVVVYNHNRLTVNGERQGAKPMRLNMIFNERAAVVYHFSPKYFAGASLMMSNSIFHDNSVVVNQNKWLARAFVGIRL